MSHDLILLQVMDAMRTAVTNLLGSLPPSYFNVTVSAKQEDMAQIMYSALMMGYMYRNAQYRIDLDYDAQIEGELVATTFTYCMPHITLNFRLARSSRILVS